MKNEEGLRYPSIDNLLTKIDSKYKLAYASAKRAKIIKEEEPDIVVGIEDIWAFDWSNKV